MKSFKNFLPLGAVVGTLVMSLIIYTGISIGYEWYITKQSVERAEKMAVMTLSSLYELMREGWSGEQLDSFLKTNRAAYEQLNLQVLYYGDEALRTEDLPDSASEAFQTGKPLHHQHEKQVTFTYPQILEADCLSCHTDLAEGDVLGVIEVREDLYPTIRDARRDTLLFLLAIFPFPIIGSFIISRYLAARVQRSIEELHARIERINRTEDLQLIEMNHIDLTFTELNTIYDELKEVARKLSIIAVDKDILEFEVKLLEKFVITSEVVKDWEEHVKTLLVEINKIIEVHLIFSLFKIEDEDYALEVFWLYTPAEETRKTFERIIGETLEQTILQIKDGVTGLKINHTVAFPKQVAQELDEDEINLQTKSLFLETPRIGGIVGIGVNSSLAKNPTRALVIESILTTLLNVIGSVKAVYEYTRELEYFATRDPLTDLYTQRVFWEMLDDEVVRAGKHGYQFAVLFIDLDDFKLINDVYGHLVGDKVLQNVAQMIREILRPGDILTRYGGDEYAIILPYADQDQALSIANGILERMQAVILQVSGGKSVRVAASIGIAVYPDHADDAKNMFLIADNMMYKAKDGGKGKVGFPSAEDIVEIFRVIQDKNMLLMKALEENKVVPFFQPIIDVKTDRTYACEILMRIDLPEGMMVAGDFVEIAEGMGIISKLDYMLMDKALEKVAKEQYEGHLFFNLSPKALIVSEFVPRIRKLVKKHGIPSERIVFEITERDTVKNLTVLEKFVRELKREGFQFAIDDFGSGFSSFQYLKRLPIDIIKIEGDFIRSLAGEGKTDKAIVLSIVTLARELQIKMVAEFVENEAIHQKIAALGIDYAQGYYMGMPTPNLGERHTNQCD